MIKSETAANYSVQPSHQTDDDVIAAALGILQSRLERTEELVVTSPADTRNFLKLKLAHLEHEVFAVLFLDNRHQLIAYEELFRGTIDGASVYPREVVKRALELNAAALIFSHNHPSGITEPSQADENITRRLRTACSTVDIRVLDHIIVGATESVSLAERGVI